MSALVEPSEIHRLTIEEYHQLIESGGLDEDTRVELIEGLVVDMSPRSPEHENALRWFIDWLVAQLDHVRYQFMIAGSMTIGRSEPEPDVTVLQRTPPVRAHPSRAPLVIEIALSSADRDLRSKPAVYAGSVQEYWVVDLQRQVVVVHCDGEEGTYREVTIVPRGERLSARAVDIGEVPTGELFAAALAQRP